jgi:hypothetical protein
MTTEWMLTCKSTELSNLRLSRSLCYDRRSVAQSDLEQSNHLGLTTRFYYSQTVAGLLMRGALSDERTSLPFTIVAGPRQRSHSWVRVPQDSRLPQPGGPSPRIYIPQEQGCPVIPPGSHGSTSPPRMTSRRTDYRSPSQTVPLLFCVYPLLRNVSSNLLSSNGGPSTAESVSSGKCLLNPCLAMAIFVTIYL